jgi:hypothetical protein
LYINVKIQIYERAILLTVEILPFNVREETRLRVILIKMLRRICGPKGGEVSEREGENYLIKNLYSSPYTWCSV